jgi:iron complex outermembrane receptor protein
MGRTLAFVLVLATLMAGCGGRPPESSAPVPGGIPEGGEADKLGSDVRVAGDLSVDRGHYENVLEMIRGMAPGLQIIGTGGSSFDVRIRGASQTLGGGGSQSPLVVVDGVPSSRSAGEALLALHPSDVASISVLRDVASTVIYGIRGANGVILVRTKRKGW